MLKHPIRLIYIQRNHTHPLKYNMNRVHPLRHNMKYTHPPRHNVSNRNKIINIHLYKHLLMQIHTLQHHIVTLRLQALRLWQHITQQLHQINITFQTVTLIQVTSFRVTFQTQANKCGIQQVTMQNE